MFVSTSARLIAVNCLPKITFLYDACSQDKNKVSEQLQSLKTQVATLRRAVQKKRAEHLQSAAAHQRLAGEIEAAMDALAEKEAEARSRPLLAPAAEDVERRLSEHDRLAAEVEPVLDRIRRLRDEAKSEGGDCDVNLPASVANILSSAAATLASMPQELADRRAYLEENRDHRLRYDGLVERLNNWVEEAQLKLRQHDSGVDFANVEDGLKEHKEYFGQEGKVKELLEEIHATSNKIWASLEKAEQDKHATQQEFFNQLVRNYLPSVFNYGYR